METFLNKQNIENARIVLSAGRGLDTAAVPMLYEMANRTGAAVAGTRAAAEKGSIDKDDVIGLSGHKISAELYVAFGVSGAGFHMMGIRRQCKIVAVNTDKAAGIIKRANIAVIADAAQTLCEALKMIKDTGAEGETSEALLIKIFKTLSERSRQNE